MNIQTVQVFSRLDYEGRLGEPVAVPIDKAASLDCHTWRTQGKPIEALVVGQEAVSLSDNQRFLFLDR